MLRPINPAALRTSLVDSAPAHEAASDPAGFSSLLRQQTQVSTPAASPAPAPPPVMQTSPRAAANDTPAAPTAASPSNDAAAATPERPDADAPAEPTDAPTRARGMVGRPRLRGADATPRGPGAETHANGDAAAVNTAPTIASADTPAGAAAAPPLAARADWLAALHARPAPTEKTAPATSDAPEATDATAATHAMPADAGALRDASDAGAAAARHAAAGTDHGNAAPVFAATLAEHRDVRLEARADASAAAPIGAAGLAATPTIARDSAAPLAVALPTPVDAPDFAQTLGLQLSILAKDGVQQAELHLNPAEMGPVSVQIVMDGTQARIDFGADVAATRHAIEAGLPELASALRDAGYTLAGGGVSQHAGSRARDGSGSPSPRGDARRARPASEESVTRVGQAARRLVSRGGVDLYA